MYIDRAAQPAVALALPDPIDTETVAERLQARGWRVLRAGTPVEIRRLAGRYRVDVVVLPVESPEESGWIACAKLRCARPRLKVFLLGERTPAALRFAQFVGATELIPPQIGAIRLAETIAQSADTVTV
jgi:DNA-binding NarL/FixJ family response regulator